MEMSRNEFYTLLCFGASFSFLAPSLISKHSIRFAFAKFFSFFENQRKLFVQKEPEETLSGIREQAKLLLVAARNKDERAMQKVKESFTDKNSRFYGVFRVSKTTQETVLAGDPSRPAQLTLRARDSDGDMVWQPSVPTPLEKS
jgi:hypothetical protein